MLNLLFMLYCTSSLLLARYDTVLVYPDREETDSKYVLFFFVYYYGDENVINKALYVKCDRRHLYLNIQLEENILNFLDLYHRVCGPHMSSIFNVIVMLVTDLVPCTVSIVTSSLKPSEQGGISCGDNILEDITEIRMFLCTNGDFDV